jgi:hypothetical protein
VLLGVAALAPSQTIAPITLEVSLVFALITRLAPVLALENGKVLIAVSVLLNSTPISIALPAHQVMRVVIPTATESAQLSTIAVITPTLSLVM